MKNIYDYIALKKTMFHLQLIEIIESLLISIKLRVSSTVKTSEYVAILRRFFTQHKISEPKLVEDYLNVMEIGEGLITEQQAKYDCFSLVF